MASVLRTEQEHKKKRKFDKKVLQIIINIKLKRKRNVYALTRCSCRLDICSTKMLSRMEVPLRSMDTLGTEVTVSRSFVCRV